MLRKSLILGLALAFLASASNVRAATVLNFDPDGLGPAGAIGDFVGFDWKPGNALADGGNASVATFVATATKTSIPGLGDVYSGGTRTPFTVYIQAAVPSNGILTRAGGTTNPVAGSEFTLVMAFQEVVTSVIIDPLSGVADVNFALAPVQTNNFLEIYYHSAENANDLEGTGFNDGTRILSGTITSLIDSGFTARPDLAIVNLDTFGVDNYDGPGGNAGPTSHVAGTAATDTIQGGGSSKLEADVASVDSNFFLGGLVPLSLNFSFFDATQTLPFDSVDPSARFVKAAGGAAPVVDGAGDPTNVSLGGVNGAFLGAGGPDVQFEADGNQSFNLQIQGVPEPASVGIWGLVIAGALLYRRRSSSKASA